MAEVNFSEGELRDIADQLDLEALAGELELKDLAEHVNMDELADLMVEKMKEEEAPEEDGEEVSSLSTRLDDLEDTAETAIRENDLAHARAVDRIEVLEGQVEELREQLAKLEPVLNLANKLDRLVKKLERFLG